MNFNEFDRPFDRHQVVSTSDPVIINALMFICKIMHDSVK